MNILPPYSNLVVSQLELEKTHPIPVYDEHQITYNPPDEVFANLNRIDWSFEADNTKFLAHDVHPYPAKFIPQIPGNLISALSGRGELVFDCFGGSGTTALEAVRLGRRALSMDANPLSALIGRVKTTPIKRKSARELNVFQTVIASELQNGLCTTDAMSVYGSYSPEIPNREKWFADTALAELCLIRGRISELQDQSAIDVAMLALSRIVIQVSFQHSETRYKSVPRLVPSGETLQRYLRAVNSILQSLAQNEAAIRYGIAEFICADTRTQSTPNLAESSVDLVVTSPPYGNATDYHLYHRFRLLWLGFNPKDLGKIEIGSHLKHQREASGFDSYYDDLRGAVCTISRVLRPGRYAALVLGDSIYKGERYDPAERLADDMAELGFDALHFIDRKIHDTKRSFAHTGRRATQERIVILRRKEKKFQVVLEAPPYKLWPYEQKLRSQELRSLGLSTPKSDSDANLKFIINIDKLPKLKNLVFSHKLKVAKGPAQPTWQAILENGAAANPGSRKDPKYVTHGIHPYKGKFYPQLAKALLNITGLVEGAKVLDPFCGSGTALLESYLNGYEAYGCDMNPVAARVAKVKTQILETNPDLLTEAVSTLIEVIEDAPTVFPEDYSEFESGCIEEIDRWFPKNVVGKLNWLLRTIRKNSAGTILDFFEVVLSSVIREVSHQEPSDLRIRYRKKRHKDADLLGLFKTQLEVQYLRIEKYWATKGWAPCEHHPAFVIEGDNREMNTYCRLGLKPGSVDMVLTSPPYGTALPYIDTDRLSLLSIWGLTSSERRPIESNLIGSREINVHERQLYESGDLEARLPSFCTEFIKKMKHKLDRDLDAGFRKTNMPSLMTRYLLDMKSVFANLSQICSQNADIFIVIGDNRMVIGGKVLPIPTTNLVSNTALSEGFDEIERINISVTTENLLNQKNAITENVVLRLKRSF